MEEYYKNKYKNVLHRIKCLKKHTAYIEGLHSSDRLFESAHQHKHLVLESVFNDWAEGGGANCS